VVVVVVVVVYVGPIKVVDYGLHVVGSIPSRGRDISPQSVKLLKHEADHPPPPNADVKNTWIFTTTPPTPTITVTYTHMKRGQKRNRS
jgi:hypothetical protein